MNIQDMCKVLSRMMDEYTTMSKRVRSLEKEMEQLKGTEPKKQENEENTDDTVLISTKYPHMKILLPNGRN